MGMTSEEAKGYKPLGEELRRLRKSKKMTRKELAAVVGNGCSEKTISQYENGSRPMEVETYFFLEELSKKFGGRCPGENNPQG